MRRANVLLLALCVAALSGCDSMRYFLKKPDAVEAGCDESCFKDCEPLDKWDGTADHAAAIVKIDGLLYGICSERRASCEACIRRLERNGVIKRHGDD